MERQASRPGASMGSEVGRTVKAVARSSVRQASEAVPSWRPDLARAYRKRWSAQAQRRRTAGPQLTLASRRGLPSRSHEARADLSPAKGGVGQMAPDAADYLAVID